MLKKYRNALLNVVRAANLDPRHFRPQDEEIGGYQSFRLRVGDGNLYFVIQTTFVGGKRQFHYWYSTFVFDHKTRKYPEYQLTGWYDFERVEEGFRKWLDEWAQQYIEIQAEEEEDKIVPDLWAELDLPSDSVVDSQNIQNTMFSSEEQRRIAETLKEFEEEVQRREILSAEQVKLLHERVEYLVESSKRLGRKDWLAAAAGALIGFTFQAGLTSDVAIQIIHLSGEALRWIAHTPLLLP